MRITLLSVGLLVGTLAMVSAQGHQGHQGAMGVWVLNLQKSSFNPGPLPQLQTSTWTLLPDGRIKIENDGIDAQGQKFHREMFSRFDGTQEARTGLGQPTTRGYRWLDDLNFEFEEKVNGQPATIGRTVMSRDGRVRTLTVNGTRDGKPLHNVEVYERHVP